MKTSSKNIAKVAALVAVCLAASGCGGDSGGGGGGGDDAAPIQNQPQTLTPIDVAGASLVTSMNKASGGEARSATDFSFPTTENTGQGYALTIPSAPPPLFPARRTTDSSGGNPIGFGDSVILKYDMFAWSTGQLVESSAEYTEAVTVTSGITDQIGIPEYVAQSLLGRSLGDVIQVVLPVGANGLPEYLNANDAYVLMIELL